MPTSDGIGKPLSVLNDPALVTVNPVGGQTADTINFENLVGMIARLHPALLTDALWVASPSYMAQLLVLSFPVKNATGYENVGGERASAEFDAGRRTFALLGLPSYFSGSLPTLADKGDILLIAPSQYAYGLGRDIWAGS